MKTKEEIVNNWLPRYTGEALENFGKYILLTNFSNYITMFAKWNKVKIVGADRPMQCATADGITIINFGMGSPGAATVMDLLTAINPEAVLFLGKCGGLKKRNKIGDLILPIAAIRGEGTSNDYFRRKFRQCPHSLCRKRSQQPSAIIRLITGPAPCTPPTEGYGNMMMNSRPTSPKYALTQSIWKRPLFLQ
jgi:nucleoside phosphorylase